MTSTVYKNADAAHQRLTGGISVRRAVRPHWERRSCDGLCVIQPPIFRVTARHAVGVWSR